MLSWFWAKIDTIFQFMNADVSQNELLEGEANEEERSKVNVSIYLSIYGHKKLRKISVYHVTMEKSESSVLPMVLK